MDVTIKVSDGYENITDSDFTLMVTKRLTWYKNKLSSVFGGVKVHEVDGYYVFIAEKRRNRKNKPSNGKQKKLSKKLERKYGSG